MKWISLICLGLLGKVNKAMYIKLSAVWPVVVRNISAEAGYHDLLLYDGLRQCPYPQLLVTRLGEMQK
jgi:hypothetical protein